MTIGIRGKLIFLIAILVAAFGVTVTIYLYVRSPVNEIRSEQQTLVFLRTAFLSEALSANRLTNSPFRIELDTFKSAVETTTFSFMRVVQLKILPRTNESVREALASIEKLKGILDADTGALLGSVGAVQEVAVRYYGPFEAYSLLDLAMNSRLDNDPLKQKVVVDVHSLTAQLGKLTDDLISSVAVINKEARIIDKAIVAVEGRSAAVALIVIIALAAGTLLSGALPLESHRALGDARSRRTSRG